MWPLENQKNNGPIDLKVTGYVWSKLYIILISDLKIQIYRAVFIIFDVENHPK